MQQYIYYTKYADVSAIYDGKFISFTKPVTYNITNNILSTIV